MVVNALLCRGEEKDALWSLIEEEEVKRRKEMKKRKRKEKRRRRRVFDRMQKRSCVQELAIVRSKGKKHREQE